MRLLVLVLSLVLAACGSDEPTPAASAPAASSATEGHSKTEGHDHAEKGHAKMDGHDHAKAGHDHAAMDADAAFSCPMHPEVTGKEGDRCPKCNMFLTAGGKEMDAKMDGHDHAKAGHDHAAKDADGAAAYYCPMHPEVTSDEAGQRCGKCNMFLVKPGDEAKHTGG